MCDRCQMFFSYHQGTVFMRNCIFTLLLSKLTFPVLQLTSGTNITEHLQEIYFAVLGLN